MSLKSEASVDSCPKSDVFEAKKRYPLTKDWLGFFDPDGRYADYKYAKPCRDTIGKEMGNCWLVDDSNRTHPQYPTGYPLSLSGLGDPEWVVNSTPAKGVMYL